MKPCSWKFSFLLISLLFMNTKNLIGQIDYQKPPKKIQKILDLPPTPSISVSPTRDKLLLLHRDSYPSIKELSRPMLRLAGYRIDPQNNGPFAKSRISQLSLMDLEDLESRDIKLPKGTRVSNLRWAPTGKQFAFTVPTETSIQLWLGNTTTGKIQHVPNLKLNTAYGEPVQWMPDGVTLLCQSIPKKRGKPPQASPVPTGPRVMEASGKDSPVRTYQDLLRNPHDEKLFEYYATSQLVLVHSETLKVKSIGKANIIRMVDPSPDGKYLLVAWNHRPFSYLLPAYYFPREVEVWDLRGKVVHKVASLPLAEEVPIEGVRTGPRYYHWLPTEEATLIWTEALDDGDPAKEATHRDRLLMHPAPFKKGPSEWFKTEQRFVGMTWAEKNEVFVRDYDRDRRWRRTFLVDSMAPDKALRLIWSRSIQDRYGDPGSLVLRTLENGHRIAKIHDNKVFLIGSGSSPQGDRPFFDEFDLTNLKSRRIFQCAEKTYEFPVALVTAEGGKFITRHETLKSPPNFFLRVEGKAKKVALTEFQDPAPELRKIKKELVTYQRQDGVNLSFTLYLPPGHKRGKRLPAIVWAYPREYTDDKVAGQVSGSPHRFTNISGSSHLFFLLEGYAVLDSTTMPVVGEPETVNNTFVKQIVNNAQAAIDKASEMGIIDRDRVGIAGHSYGAFMTANLLAHCDLFKAGIARSGAYNRTLTPFGFQNERRTLWQARDTYVKVSPYLHADKIEEPLLLIHGRVDNNSGTFPLQSERMYHAVKGNAGTVRLVMLPHESHSYRARESIEHTLYEMISWFDRHVKNKKVKD